MTYLEFNKVLSVYPVFSVKDIRKRFPDFDRRRLAEWWKKGFLIKIKRGYYCFEERKKGEQFLSFAANKIYSPSYISLESALAYYNFIPEGVFITSSVTTKNTARYDSPLANFEYRHIKPSLFFGYKLLREKDFTIKIAEPEKCLLDYFYLNTLNSVDEIEAMRFNEVQIKELISFEKLAKYQRVFNSKILNKRIKLLLKTIHA